jgi:hypothetical protein
LDFSHNFRDRKIDHITLLIALLACLFGCGVGGGAVVARGGRDGSSDTALNFIKCPNCRSLVPHIAEKCRVCGASLPKTDVENEGEEV